MKIQLACQDSNPQEVEISHFKFLTSMLEEDQLIDHSRVLSIDYDLGTFRAYQAFMDHPFKIQAFQTDFIEMAIMLDDDRFPDLIKNYRSSVLAGQLGLGSLKFEHLSIIFGCLEEDIYSLGQIGRLLESKKMRTSWKQLYPFFPITKAQNWKDLQPIFPDTGTHNWQATFLNKIYGLDLNDLRLVDFSLEEVEITRYDDQYVLWAARHGLLQILEYLISRFKLYQESVRQGRDATGKLLGVFAESLIQAARRGHLGMVKLFCRQFMIHQFDLENLGYQPVTQAIKGGHFKIVSFFYFGLLHQFDLKSSNNDLICYWLYKAAKHGHSKIFKFLSRRFSLDFHDLTHPNTPAFFKAIEGGHLALVRYMAYQYFRDEAYEDRWGCGLHALSLAIKYDHLEIAQFVTDYFHLDWMDSMNSDDDLLISALTHSSLAIVTFLWEQFNFSLETVRGQNNLALIRAAHRGKLEILQFLVRKYPLTRADVRSQNNRALREASAQGHDQVVQFLISEFKLTLTDIRTNHNEAFHGTIFNGHHQVVQSLCRQGLTVEDLKHYYQNNSVLAVACGYGHLEVVKFLHSWFDLSPAEIQADDNKPLLWAAHGRQLSVIIYLCQEFNRIDLEPSFGHLIIHVASTGQLKMMDFFCSHFKLQWTDDWAQLKMAYLMATAHGQLEMVKFLTDRLKLSRTDLEGMASYLLQDAAENKFPQILDYFNQQFGFESETES